MRLALRSLESRLSALYHSGNIEIAVTPTASCYREVRRLLGSRALASRLREELQLCEPGP